MYETIIENPGTNSIQDSIAEDCLHLASNIITAKGKAVLGGFIVFKGSEFNPTNAISAAKGI